MASFNKYLERICKFKNLSTNSPATAPIKSPKTSAMTKFPIDTFKEFQAFK